MCITLQYCVLYFRSCILTFCHTCFCFCLPFFFFRVWTVQKNNSNLRIKNRAFHGRRADGISLVFIYSMVTYIWPINQTYSVASSPTVTGSVFMQRLCHHYVLLCLFFIVVLKRPVFQTLYPRCCFLILIIFHGISHEISLLKSADKICSYYKKVLKK